MKLARMLLSTIVLALVGCAQFQPATNDADGWTSRLSKFTKRSLEKVTPRDRDQAPLRRDWATAIPRGLQRADVISHALPDAAIAHFVPQLQAARQVKLASTSQAQQGGMLLTSVDNKPVANFADLLAYADALAGGDKPVQVEFKDPAAPASAPASAAKIKPKQLASLAHATLPEHSVVRVHEDGNPWILVKRGGVRCKVMARVERGSGLLHVLLTPEVLWGNPTMLPKDVAAAYDGAPLRCLTVAEALEALYGEDSETLSQAEPGAHSFAGVSEREDYLIPTNYKRLASQVSTSTRFSMSPPTPAFALAATVPYPGPAVLGDARALSSFVVQRELYKMDDAPQTGWIVFGPADIGEGGTIEVFLDLGQGPIRLSFMVPPA